MALTLTQLRQSLATENGGADPYKDLNDEQLSDQLYKSHYADMDREDFNSLIQYAPPKPAVTNEPSILDKAVDVGKAAWQHLEKKVGVGVPTRESRLDLTDKLKESGYEPITEPDKNSGETFGTHGGIRRLSDGKVFYPDEETGGWAAPGEPKEAHPPEEVQQLTNKLMQDYNANTGGAEPSWASVARSTGHQIVARGKSLVAGAKEQYNLGEANTDKTLLWQSTILPEAVQRAKAAGTKVEDDPKVQLAAERLGIPVEQFAGAALQMAGRPANLRANQERLWARRLDAEQTKKGEAATSRGEAFKSTQEAELGLPTFSAKGLTAQAASFAPELTTQIAATIINPVLGAAVAFGEFEPESFSDAKNAGASDDTAGTYAVLSGMAMTAPQVPLLAVLGRTGAGNKILQNTIGRYAASRGGKLVGASAIGAIDNATRSALMIGLNAGYLDEHTSLPDALAQIGAAAIVGGTVAGGLHTVLPHGKPQADLHDTSELWRSHFAEDGQPPGGPGLEVGGAAAEQRRAALNGEQPPAEGEFVPGERPQLTGPTGERPPIEGEVAQPEGQRPAIAAPVGQVTGPVGEVTTPTPPGRPPALPPPETEQPPVETKPQEGETPPAIAEPEAPKGETPPKKRAPPPPAKADAKKHSLIEYLALHEKGIDAVEAEAHGIDKADMNSAAAKVGIRRAFRKNGMTFDEAAEHLAEAGYPVKDKDGNYTPNAVLAALDKELRGKKVYSDQNDIDTRFKAEAEQTRQDLVDAGEAHKDISPEVPPIAERPPEVHDWTALADQARQHDPEATEHAMEGQDDAQVKAKLEEIIANGQAKERTAVEPVAETTGGGESPPEAARPVQGAEKAGLPDEAGPGTVGAHSTKELKRVAVAYRQTAQQIRTIFQNKMSPLTHSKISDAFELYMSKFPGVTGKSHQTRVNQAFKILSQEFEGLAEEHHERNPDLYKDGEPQGQLAQRLQWIRKRLADKDPQHLDKLMEDIGNFAYETASNERPEAEDGDLSDAAIEGQKIDFNEMPYPHQWKESMDNSVGHLIRTSGMEGATEAGILKSLRLDDGSDDKTSVEYKRYLAASEAFERALTEADTGTGEHNYELVPGKHLTVRVKHRTLGEIEAEKKASAETTKAAAKKKRDARIAVERQIAREAVAMPAIIENANAPDFKVIAAGHLSKWIDAQVKDAVNDPDRLAGLADLRTMLGTTKKGDEFMAGLQKEAQRAAKQAELDRNRDPEVYKVAISEAMAAAKVGNEDPVVQQQEAEAFKAGWDHALSGKTKSTLTGDSMVTKSKGYEQARGWMTTEEGKAWHTGKAKQKKLENTGADLRRFWEQAKKKIADAKASGSAIEVWEEIEPLVERGVVFNPEIPEGASGGLQRYVEQIRGLVHSFKDYAKTGGFLSEMGGYRQREGFDELLKRLQERIDRVDQSGKDYYDKRIAAMREQADDYVTLVGGLSDALSGHKTITEAAKAVEAYIWPMVKDKGWHYAKLHNFMRGKPDWGLTDYSLKRALLNEATPYVPPTRATPLVPPKLDRVERTGLTDYRKGKDVTPAEFKKKFGFADVGFGKWVKSKQDQDHLNYSYDAFMDLAKVLGIKPELIGLSTPAFGKPIHFTIGALGHGKHAAHFSYAQPSPEGVVQVINVTNTKGDGTVAHEWTHALDWSQRKNNGELMHPAFKTLAAVLKTKATDWDAYWEATVKRFLRGDSKFTRMGRGADARAHAMQALTGGYYAHPPKSQFMVAAEKMDEGSQKPYWSTDHELIARSSEAYLFDKLGENRNTYLINPWVADGKTSKATGYRGTPYPEAEERKEIAKAYDKLYGALVEKDGALTIPDDTLKSFDPQEGYNSARERAKGMLDQWIAEIQDEREAQAIARRVEEENKRRGAEPPKPPPPPPPPPVEPDPSQSMGPVSEDEASALFDQIAAQLDESVQEQPGVEAIGDPEDGAEPAPKAEQPKGEAPKGEKKAGAGPKRSRKAAEMIAEAAKLGVKGIDESLSALADLFGAGRIQSFPGGLDAETYRKAKVHFDKALAAFREAGKTLADLFRHLIQALGQGIKPYLMHWTKESRLSMDLAPSESPSMSIAKWVKQRLSLGETIDWSELFDKGDSVFGGTQASGQYTPKDAYDALEAGVNLWLRENGYKGDRNAHSASIEAKSLAEMTDLLPTQTKRTPEMDEFQQFSTPPAYAYVANWLAKIQPGEQVLEPSAGVGGLAIFAENSGGRMVLNELSKRRLAVLKGLFPEAQIFAEDGAQLNNILPPTVAPTVVIMNPPFSATAGRVEGKRDTMEGARHVEQALERLAPGGRLVAIVGQGMANDTAQFKDWWKKIKENYYVRANVGVDGSGYAKYGTTFDNQFLVIDKPGDGTAPSTKPVFGKVGDVSELPQLLKEIQDDRQKTNAADSSAEQGPVEPSGPDTPARPAQGQALPDGTTGGRPAAGPLSGDAGPGPADHGRLPDKATPPEGPKGPNALPDTGRGRRGPPGAGRPARDVALGEGDVGGALARPDSSERLAIGKGERAAAEGELTDSIFENYTPALLRIPGAQPHRGALVESAAMSAVQPPPPVYSPSLPKEIITSGALSLAQMEPVVYAGQAHQNILPNGDREGFLIGDGTGVGKGREIAGIILDNFRQGRGKAVWVSEKHPLAEDALRDAADIGLVKPFPPPREGEKPRSWKSTDAAPGKMQIHRHMFVKGTKAIPHKDGILFTAYSTLRMGAPENVKEGEIKQSRVQQMASWLGKDFDGVIVFDEAHAMANVEKTKGTRGSKEPSKQAQAAMELQKVLPKARVVYVSATAATEVRNLGYTTRLGLWGEKTPFANATDFINKIGSAGVAAMELVARDLKALGKYSARSLSFDGIKYQRLTHELNQDQKAVYDRVADAWQVVLANIHDALAETGAEKSRNKGQVMSQFWSSHQRFFNQIITAMQMPSVIEEAKKDYAAGSSIVFQLVNTNEAEQERAAAKRKPAEGEEEDTSDEGLEFGPMDSLINFVDKAFPTQQYHEESDDEGRTTMVPTVDSEGNPVQSAKALAMKKKLIEDLKEIAKTSAIPGNPLDLIIEHFGTADTAEVTGRGRRFIRRQKKDGSVEMEEQKRGHLAIAADSKAFQDDKKRVLIFSMAGGTGFSYHASNRVPNQRLRRHYLIQPGWQADKAVQGFGRTHRTDQKQPPEYVLATTDLPAQRRFMSSIARRLDQLGALTRGERKAGSQLFSADDNLESQYAIDAQNHFWKDLYSGLVEIPRDALPDLKPELTSKEIMALPIGDPRRTAEAYNKAVVREDSEQGRAAQEASEEGDFVKGKAAFEGVTDQMGLNLLDPKTGNLSESKLPEIRIFLNRLLSLKVALQHVVFDAFYSRMDELVQKAVEEGTYDKGLENLKALSTRVMADEPVFTEEKSGALTRYLELEQTKEAELNSWEDVKARAEGAKKALSGFYRDERTGQIFMAVNRGKRVKATGEVVIKGQRSDVIGSPRYIENLASIEAGGDLERHKRMGPWFEGPATPIAGFYGSRSVVERFNQRGYDNTKEYIEKVYTGAERGPAMQVLEEAKEKAVEQEGERMIRRYTKLADNSDNAAVEAEWTKAHEDAPKTKTSTVHMITGVVLPIWDRFPDSKTRVGRVQTEDGQRLLGRIISEEELGKTLRNLGVNPNAKLGPADVMKKIMAGQTAVLSNGWMIRKVRVSNDTRIEISRPGANFSDAEGKLLVTQGAFAEKIQWSTRYFLPTGDAAILERVMAGRPVVEFVGGGAPMAARGGKMTGGVRVSHLVRAVHAELKGHAIQPDEVIIRDTMDELPSDARMAIELTGNAPTAQAFFWQNPRTGKLGLYFLASKIHKLEDVPGLVAHEYVAHFGLRATLDEGQYNEIMDGIARDMPEELRKRGLIQFGGEKSPTNPTGYDPTDELHRHIAAEELIAYYAGDYLVKPQSIPARIRGWLQRIIDALKSYWRKATGQHSYDMTYVRQLLRDLKEHLARGSAARKTERFRKMEPAFRDRMDFAQVEPVYYSEVVHAVENSKLTKAPGDQWWNTIKNQPGVKAEELDWLGLEEWLKGKSGSIPKAQVEDFVRSNQVRIREVVKTNDAGVRDRIVEQLEAMGWTPEEGMDGEPYLMPRENDDGTTEYPPPEAQALVDSLDSAEGGVSLTKYDDRVLLGGADYVELLLMLPDTSQEDMSVAESPPGWAEAGNSRSTRPRIGAGFQSSHWNEENVVVHVRGNTRVDGTGMRVFHVEEIQSDWHQAGRKVGYKAEIDTAEVARLTDHINRLQLSGPTDAELKEYFTPGRVIEDRSGNYDKVIHFEPAEGPDRMGGRGRGWSVDVIATNQAGEPLYGQRERTHRTAPTVEMVQDLLRKRDEVLQKGRVADAPFKHNWTELAFKRVLRYAVDHGFERVTWTTGAQQADRYDLTKHVGSIHWKKNSGANDSYYVSIFDPSHNPVFDRRAISAQGIEEHVGKEIAEKIVNSPDEKGVLSGLDLKTGGKGMIGYYDQILPATVNKLVKKWGGKVGTTDLASQTRDYEQFLKERPYLSKQKADEFLAWARDSTSEKEFDQFLKEGMKREDLQWLGDFSKGWEGVSAESMPVHSLDITTPMKESVLGGLPMFARQQGPSVTSAPQKGVGKKAYDKLRRALLFVPNSEVALSIRRIVDPANVSAVSKQTARITSHAYGELAHQSHEVLKTLEQYSRLIDQLHPDVLLEMMDAIEEGRPQPVLELQPVADTLRKLLDEARERVRALGVGALENWIESYFPHIWRDPSMAARAMGMIMGRRPMQGPKSFLKKRTIPTIKEGIAVGLKPVSYNPLILALLKIREMDRFVTGVRLMQKYKELGLAQFIRAGMPKPPDWEFIDDSCARVRQWSEIEKGFIERGRYAMPSDAARVINNHLSASALRNFVPAMIFRQFSNAMNALQLGFSAFHLGFTTLDAVSSKGAVAIERLMHGEPLKAAAAFAELATGPGAALANLYRGFKLLQAYQGNPLASPMMRAIAKGVSAGGGRVQMDRYFSAAEGGSPFHGTGFVSLAVEIKQALQGTDKVRGVAHAAGHFPAEYATRMYRDIQRMVREYPKWQVPFEIGGRVVRASTSWIMEYIVPLQKLGVFADLAGDWLRRNPNVPEDSPEHENAMQAAWRAVDNRLGEMVYDNTFWNRTFKDVLHMAIRAVGWNKGTLVIAGGAPIDVIKAIDKLAREGKIDADDLGHNIPYLMAMVGSTMVLGAILNYLFGQQITELKDYFFPKTGGKTKYGTPQRVSLPSYVKDYYEYYQQPGRTFINKLNPIYGTLADLMTNEDFYGNAIMDPAGSTGKRFGESAGFVGRQMSPFSLQGTKQLDIETGSSIGPTGAKVLPFIGVTPAPGRISSAEQIERADKARSEQSYAQGLKYKAKEARQRGDLKAASEYTRQYLEANRRARQLEAEAKRDKTRGRQGDPHKITELMHGKNREQSVAALRSAGYPAMAGLVGSLPRTFKPSLVSAMVRESRQG